MEQEKEDLDVEIEKKNGVIVWQAHKIHQLEIEIQEKAKMEAAHAVEKAEMNAAHAVEKAEMEAAHAVEKAEVNAAHAKEKAEMSAARAEKKEELVADHTYYFDFALPHVLL